MLSSECGRKMYGCRLTAGGKMRLKIIYRGE
jgi:hypothetical protein